MNFPTPTTPPAVAPLVDDDYSPDTDDFLPGDEEWALYPGALYLASQGTPPEEPHLNYGPRENLPYVHFDSNLSKIEFHLQGDNKSCLVRSQEDEAFQTGLRHRIAFNLDLRGELNWATADLGPELDDQGFRVLTLYGFYQEERHPLAVINLLPRGVLSFGVCIRVDTYPDGTDKPIWKIIHSWTHTQNTNYLLVVDTTRGFGHSNVTFSLKEYPEGNPPIHICESSEPYLFPFLTKGMTLSFGIEDTFTSAEKTSPEVWTKGVIVDSDQLHSESYVPDSSLMTYLEEL